MVVKRATEHKIFRAAMSGLPGLVAVLLLESAVVPAAGERAPSTHERTFERPWEHPDGTISYRDLEFQDWGRYAAWRLSSDPSFDRHALLKMIHWCLGRSTLNIRTEDSMITISFYDDYCARR